MGFIKNGKLCFDQIAAFARDGTTISSFDEFAALRTAFATVSGFSVVIVDCFEKFSNDG